MSEVFSAIVEGVVAFTATNVDDFIILLVLFAQVDATFRPYHVISGSCWGFALLIALSLVGFFGGLVISSAWIGLLGILPIVLGIQQLMQRNREAVTPEFSARSDRNPFGVMLMKLLDAQSYKVAAVTFANGGDNIGIYTPLFAASDGIELGIILTVFFLLKILCCYAAYRLAQTPRIADILDRYSHSIVPFLLMGLGSFIMWKNGTIRLLIGG